MDLVFHIVRSVASDIPPVFTTQTKQRHQQDVRCEGRGLAIAADSFSTRQTLLLTLAGMRGRCWGSSEELPLHSVHTIDPKPDYRL